MLGAVVVVGSGESTKGSGDLPSEKLKARYGSLACVEILGRTVVGRTIDELHRAQFDSVAIVANFPLSPATSSNGKAAFCNVQDLWRGAAEKIAGFDAEAVLIVRLGAYVEFDSADMFQFHRGQGKPVTRATTSEGSLDIWVIDRAAHLESETLVSLLQDSDRSSYFVPGYVNQLETVQDLRRLAADGLGGRCQYRPQGFEVKPGVWMGQGGEVERDARIVAPAYIGRDCKVAGQCLITRGSNIESNSQVDYGTVVEDSTVLSHSYVGIGLDLSHSIVDGDSLVNLQHGVALKISDPAVLRQIKDSRVRSGIDGVLLANLDVQNMATSPTPEKAR